MNGERHPAVVELEDVMVEMRRAAERHPADPHRTLRDLEALEPRRRRAVDAVLVAAGSAPLG